MSDSCPVCGDKYAIQVSGPNPSTIHPTKPKTVPVGKVCHHFAETYIHPRDGIQTEDVDIAKIEWKLASILPLVSEIQDTDVRIAIENRLQHAHSEVSDNKDQLYRYVNG